jgi:hypothetical protein
MPLVQELARCQDDHREVRKHYNEERPHAVRIDAFGVFKPLPRIGGRKGAQFTTAGSAIQLFRADNKRPRRREFSCRYGTGENLTSENAKTATCETKPGSDKL